VDPIASFSGLASGIEWRDLVDQLMQVEARPVTLLQQRISALQTRSSAWTAFRAKVDALETNATTLAAGSSFRTFTTAIGSYSGSSAPLRVTAGATALEGSYSFAVRRLATREKLGSDAVASRTEALGLSGELLVNGALVAVAADDSLDDIAAALNLANKGTGASGVTATVAAAADGRHRLVLTADATGAAGIDLVDGTGRVLRDLGFLDAATTLKHATSDGARSDSFSSSTGAVGSLLAFGSAPAPGSVTIGGVQVALDLTTMSLVDVAQAINTAAGLAGKAFSAAVEPVTDAAGNATYRLDVSGTTAFTDVNGVLEALGVLEGARTSVARQVRSATAFTDAATGLAATGASRLDQLRIDGSAAGVQAGDTLTVTGTRGDGTTFTSTYAVGADDTLDSLTAFLAQGTDDFGSGRTASLSIAADGHLLVTDGTAGGSQLALAIVANNEGGGTLDFGTFEVEREGRAREIVAGVDALLEVDGAIVTRSSNRVTDVIAGLTLDLTAATGETVTVEVDRDTEAAVSAVEGFVDAYNALQAWVADQFSGSGASDGASARPLSGDSALRQMRSQLRAAMQTQLLAGVAGDLGRLADVGIEVDRYGQFQLDAGALREALESDADAVARLFGVYGVGSAGDLRYVASTDATLTGSYLVDVTRAATAAGVSGGLFGGGLGTYQDDGTPDLLTVRDLGTDSLYSIELAAGDSLQDVIDALNQSFGSATRRRLEASGTLHADVGGTAATEATTLADLHAAGGAPMGVAAGDVFTISGTGTSGAAFLVEYTVTDPATETVGTLLTQIRAALGPGVDVSLSGGRLVAQEVDTGRSSLTLSLGSDNLGGGSFSLGSVDVAEAGRSTARITASDDEGALRLAHADYGSSEGFEIALAAGGADGTASLGLAGGTWAGEDVEGTIGGYAATGTGRFFTGAEDTPVSGLMLSYEGADTGSVGTLTFSRGVASMVALAASSLLDAGAGSIDSLTERLGEQVAKLSDRILSLEARLEIRREGLIRRFTAMEQAMARAQAQSQWLSSQITSLERSRD
jgi:flagellar hook-associated protein 2